MEMKVIWSDSATDDLKNIHFYYKLVASKETATRIITRIVDKTRILEHTPRAGQEEELLKHLKKEIRYLVEGNYKIVYVIEDSLVIISTVFDCRQNPQKLRKRKIKRRPVHNIK